jgi:hypothetical protein
MVSDRLIMLMMPRIVDTMSQMMATVRVNATIIALHVGIKLMTMGRITSIMGIVFR